VFRERELRSLPTIALGGRRMKRYQLTVMGSAITPPMQAVAEAFAIEMLPERDETPAAGFLILHHGDDALWLNAYSWVWDNVVHCRTASSPPRGDRVL